MKHRPASSMRYNFLKKNLSVQAVIVAMAVSVVFNCVLAARKPAGDTDARARRARTAAYINASQSMGLDDSARYAKMLMSENIRRTADDHEAAEWAIFDQLTLTNDRSVRSVMINVMADMLERHPVAPDRYYQAIVSDMRPRAQYETIRRWVVNNPGSTMANAMWAYVRAFVAENIADPEISDTFSDYIGGRTSVGIADEILASADSLRTRLGVNPAIEQVTFRMLSLKRDTAAIEKRASELIDSYSADPVIGPVLLDGYTAI
ncbi:MAG: hypothetical protein K2K84_07840, partial [Muribaculaceae bacterium]|nr:hypothetical protein [Muribaculaceae bacterium]